MQFTLINLLPVLATLAPAIAAGAAAQPGALAGRDTRLTHRDKGRLAGHRRKVHHGACRARTSDAAAVSLASTVVAAPSAIGENAQVSFCSSPLVGVQLTRQATGSAKASAMSSAAGSPAASSVDASTGSAVASSSATAASTSSSAGHSASGGATVNGKAALTPNGNKAGMTLCTGIDAFSGKLGWCYGMSSANDGHTDK
jgi:hypothetical protein